MNKKYGPKQKDHSSIGEKCLVCHTLFKKGDYTTFTIIGVDDKENKQLMHEGKAYNAVALEIHWSCRII